MVLAALVILSAFFSASETALISLRPSKVSELVAKMAANSGILKKLKEDPHKLLITILVGNNVVNISASAYAAVVFTRLFGDSGVGIATGIMTFMILVFGEILPKSFAHQHSASISLLVARPIYFLQTILYPIVWFFKEVVIVANRIFGTKKSSTITEGELVAMLKIGTREGTINKQEQEFIENVLEFNDIEVGEIMTPRVGIGALESATTLDDAVDFAIRHSHSRIPVYRKTIDNIIGVINIKELLKFYDEHPHNRKLEELKLTMPLEAPMSKKIDKLFREFQRKHLHMAIVIDEHGGTAGLVTMEDLLEEIVGEIVDEFDPSEHPIEIIDSNNIIATGATLIEDVNDFFKMKFAANEHDTINTFLLEHLHRFPREGEMIELERAKVLVVKMKKKVVDKVKITKIEPPSMSS
ncbi:HlyC/CorC family transporter [Candidatus Peregrinibacteria bacterium]|nr:HlyC/CorC family transporter [Candidatus Peregrinibacteria bacterium]